MGAWNTLRILFAITVVLVIVLAVVVPPRINEFDEFLSGFWVSNPEFLADRDLASMHLFLDRPGADAQRGGYVVAVGRDGTERINSKLWVRVPGGLVRWWSAAYAASGGASSAEGTMWLPKNPDADVPEGAGTPIILTADGPGGLRIDTIAENGKLYTYARLIRDNETSLSVIPKP
jgi:hypothetical protein